MDLIPSCRAYDHPEGYTLYYFSTNNRVTNQISANIHDDPRWLPFQESVGKSPE